MSAKPLNVPANGKPSTSSSSQSGTKTPTKTTALAKPEEISSPHELTAFVESLLTQLETKFDDMSTQVLEKMTNMSNRVDALEVAVQDLINDAHIPATPMTPAALPRSESLKSEGRSDPSE
ncbi:hypothetical protein FRB99_006127 [Tulasnella sp. 403]|nr:hypothetical protein FRB99_006127 [Tulasnella sp. 403]